MRRTRRTAALRRLVVETGLSASDLIYPVFVLDPPVI
jgi:delta-aminolevulinic acid dehydratase/porphobilinogen synthase